MSALVLIIFLVVLILLIWMFILCFSGTMIMWTTDIYSSHIMKMMSIRNNTQMFEWWQRPPIAPLFKLHIFNYTNLREFEDGTSTKLKVQELGPYTYAEQLERVNIEFHSNGTVSYNEKRSFEFLPEKTRGSLRDKIVVPSVPIMSAFSMIKDLPPTMAWALHHLLLGLDKPFANLKVHDLLWGYNDNVFALAKRISGRSLHYNKFGLLSIRNGTNPVRWTIHTGVNDISQLGVVDRYNGENQLPFWGSDECNRMDGSEGSMFPPTNIFPSSRLFIFRRELCRRFPLVFKEMTEVYGIPALRFHSPRDIFLKGDSDPNSCFCHVHLEKCPPIGIFNVTPCTFDAPILLSFPHFYLGESSLTKYIEGLHPDPKKHDLYVDIHSRFGIPISGFSRFQINVMVRKPDKSASFSFGAPGFKKIPDQTILPLAWVEIGLNELPEDMVDLLQYITTTPNRIENLFCYGLLILTIILGCIIFKILRGRYIEKKSSKQKATSTELECE